jgi:hypothetical protein
MHAIETSQNSSSLLNVTISKKYAYLHIFWIPEFNIFAGGRWRIATLDRFLVWLLLDNMVIVTRVKIGTTIQNSLKEFYEK